MYRIGICSRDKTIQKMTDSIKVENFSVKIEKYNTEDDFRKEINKKDLLPDILLMDIQWSDQAVSLAKMIQIKKKHIKIIFMAADKNEAVHIFEAEPAYLLLKPFNKQRLQYVMEQVLKKLSVEKEDVLKVQFKDKLICIPFHEIIYIESELRYLIIHRKDKTDRVRMKMSEMAEKLPGYFIRCHQSYIFNAEQMSEFERHKIIMKNGSSIAVSRNRLEETKKAIEHYYGSGNFQIYQILHKEC